MGQFQPNLARIILVWRGIKFVPMKGFAPFQGEIITKLQKYIDEFEKLFSPELLPTRVGTMHPSVKGIQNVQMKVSTLFQGMINAT